jgi:hypothetical protein
MTNSGGFVVFGYGRNASAFSTTVAIRRNLPNEQIRYAGTIVMLNNNCHAEQKVLLNNNCYSEETVTLNNKCHPEQREGSAVSGAGKTADPSPAAQDDVCAGMISVVQYDVSSG